MTLPVPPTAVPGVPYLGLDEGYLTFLQGADGALLPVFQYSNGAIDLRVGACVWQAYDAGYNQCLGEYFALLNTCTRVQKQNELLASRVVELETENERIKRTVVTHFSQPTAVRVSTLFPLPAGRSPSPDQSDALK